MRKNNTNYRYTKTFSILAAIFLSSFLFLTCKISFESDLKGYLKDYTEEVEIIGYTANWPLNSIKNTADGQKEYYIDPSAATTNFTITFSLRNPQKYDFGAGKTFASDTSPESLNLYAQFDEFIYPDTTDTTNTTNTTDTDKSLTYNYHVNIEQSNDKYKIILTLPRAFLQNNADQGKNITPTIHLTNPNSKKAFDEYESLHLICNSEPPQITNAAVYEDVNSDNEHILILTMPSVEKLSGTHKDITKLVINNKKKDIVYLVETNDANSYNFTLTPEDPTLISNDEDYYIIHEADPTKQGTSDYREEFTALGTDFLAGDGQPIYIRMKNKSDTYTVSLIDEYGLQSKLQYAYTKSSPRLASPYVTYNNNPISEGLKIKQDQNSSMATINLVPALYTYWLADSDGTARNIFRCKNSEGQIVTESFTFDEKTFDSSKSNFDNLTNESIKALRNEKWIKNNKGETDEQTYEDKINSWSIKSENTSEVTLSYTIKEGSFEYSENNVQMKPIQIPCGQVSIKVVSKMESNTENKENKISFIDSLPYECTIEVLRTRVYTGSGNGDDSKPGTVDYPFETITKAVNSLSLPSDTENTVYLLGNIKDNINIPEDGPFYVKVASSNQGSDVYSIATSSNESVSKIKTDSNGNIVFDGINEDAAVLTIPENATVILENLNITCGNIIVGEGAKLYLNNVVMNEGIIKATENSRVILGGTTKLNAVLDNEGNPIVYANGYPTSGAWILLSSTAKVQLGVDNEYNSKGQATFTSPSIKYNEETAELVLIRTEENFPELNTVIIESESPKTTAVLPTIFKDDLESEDNPCQFFKLVTPGYYIEYSNSGSTKGKGVTGIPAAKVIEPEIGGFTIELDKDHDENNVWTYQLSTRDTRKSITAKIMKGNEDYTNKYDEKQKIYLITNKKFLLSMEGDLITKGTFSVTDGKAFTMEIPYTRTTCPAGKYTLTVLFDYDGITYSDELLLNLVE